MLPSVKVRSVRLDVGRSIRIARTFESLRDSTDSRTLGAFHQCAQEIEMQYRFLKDDVGIFFEFIADGVAAAYRYSTCAASDFIGAGSLIQKLKQRNDWGHRLIARRLRGSTAEMMVRWNAGEAVCDSLQQALVEDLNRMIRGPLLPDQGDRHDAGTMQDANDGSCVHCDPQNNIATARHNRLVLERILQWELRKAPPLEGSAAMMADVADNLHIRVYTGGDEHPVFGAITRDASGVTLNEKFRGIHDLEGHAVGGNQFGPCGEENAFAHHSVMFSDLALAALATELRGQNSEVNFGSHMFDELGWRGNRSHPRFLEPDLRPFAPQRIALLPGEFSGRESFLWL